MTFRALAIAVCAAVAPLHAGAQAQSGSINGIVVSTDAQPQPITRAIVTLTGGNILDNVSAVTDPSGRFSFQNLAPGRYSVAVKKPAYLPMSYGAARTGRPGTSIALGAGQKLEIRIALPRGAVITGTVRDQSGAPAPGVHVTVSQAALVTSSGGFRSPADTLMTDDRGVYRAFGLTPDEYVVSALPRTLGNSEVTSLTRAEVDARVRELEQRHGAAAARSAAISQTQVTDTRPPGEPDRLGFAPTYYPGTTVAANAARIRVAAGDERDGVDIALVPVRAARVSGTILSGDIPPQRLRPNLTVVGPPQPMIFNPTLVGPAPDGSFSFSNVTPGRYTLLVRSGPGAMMAFTDGRAGATSDNPTVAAQFASIELDVDGRDVTGLNLSLRPSLSVSGHVVFQGTAPPPKGPAAIRISLSTTSPVGGPAIFNAAGGPAAGGSVAADGTFRIDGIVPSRYSVSTSTMPGWWLRSVMVNGRDVLDDALQFDGGSNDVTDAVLTFVDARSELGGTLTTASGQPASEFTVLVFPSDRAYWRAGARRIKTGRPASDGGFSIMDLPAGEYLLAALTDVDPVDLAQPSFFDQIVGAAVKITVTDGKKTTQDLRIAR